MSLPIQSKCLLWTWRRFTMCQKYCESNWVLGPLLRAIWSIFSAGSQTQFQWVLGSARVVPSHRFCFMDRISRCSRWEESVRFGDLRIAFLVFADDVVLGVPSDYDLQHTLGRFAVKYEAIGIRVSTSMSEDMVLCRKKADCFLRVGSELMSQVKEFERG